MLAYLFHIITFFLFKIIYSKIEDFSIIFSFELINKYKKESNDITIDSYSTYIFPNNISQIKNLLINGIKNNTLISTNLTNSIIVNQSNSQEDILCQKKIINNSQFEFQTCETYNCLVSQPNNNNDYNEIYHLFYQAIEKTKSNSIIEYDSIFALQSLEEVAMVIIDYIDNNIKIIDNDSYENNKYLFNNSIKNMIKCDATGIKFACKINYILFGMEGEKDDPYLSKEIEEDNAIAFFDNLSSYTIFPYKYLNYFLTSFFSKYNDDCKENLVKGTNLYYITCSRKKIEIFSYARNMSIIINNYAFPLKNLFNDSLKLVEESSPEKIYFNILFNKKTSNNFIFGSHFFMGKQIGYNFLDNSTYIYSKDSIDFTYNFSGGNNSTFEKLLYILTFGLFFGFLILSLITNLFHHRQVNKELENMFK